MIESTKKAGLQPNGYFADYSQNYLRAGMVGNIAGFVGRSWGLQTVPESDLNQLQDGKIYEFHDKMGYHYQASKQDFESWSQHNPQDNK
ncbi:MAG: hypothetical protein HC883_02390 [Bdellovibrionaceae bacterium]|nr:hypothetical protein [Pseudobdellovibrionaceae bacterium]